MKSNNTRPQGNVHPHPQFEFCVLCGQEIRMINAIHFAACPGGHYLGYLLCMSCREQSLNGLSEKEQRFVDDNLNAAAASLGLLPHEGA